MIVVPVVTDTIENSRKSAFNADAKMIMRAVDYKLISDQSFDPTKVDETNITDYVKASKDNYQQIHIKMEEDVPVITVVGNGKWEGLIACGTYSNMQLVNSTDECKTDLITPSIILNGDNSIDFGLGEIKLLLVGDESSYTIKTAKGLGTVKINNQAQTNDQVYGNVINKLSLNAGMGQVNIDFESK